MQIIKIYKIAGNFELNYKKKLLTMFCSICRIVESIKECERRICSIGHILCNNCDNGSTFCPECSRKISSFVAVRCLIDFITIIKYQKSFSRLKL